jgi:hypothetical protein
VRKLASLVFAGACFSSAFGQSISGTSGKDIKVLTKLIPHPYFYLAPASSAGGGYSSAAYRAEAGIDVEGTHVLFRGLGAYEDARKTDDNDQPNLKGHERYLEGAAYYRVAHGWFVGMGWRWDRLSTTNYSKSACRPEIGGGFEVMHMRTNLDWVMAGTDWQNGSHGPAITMTIPTPREKRHWFFRSSISIYRFHTTVTEPDNLALIQEQRGQQHFAGFADTGLVYRF